MKLNVLVCFILFLLSLVSCSPSNEKDKEETLVSEKSATLPLKYARGFTVHYYDGYKLIKVRDWKDTAKILAQYFVYSKATALPTISADVVKIQTPILKVVCISTTHIAEMDKLNLNDRIAGVTGASLIFNPDIHKRIKSGQITSLGNDEMNYERLVELAPSFVFTSGSFDGGDKLNIKLHALHINSVLNLDYMEQDPLARAEWLKFIAAFFDCEDKADSLFVETESRYLALKEKAKLFEPRPKVFCNLPFKEIWYMPCGENYMAQMIEDAGGDFLWKETTANNGLNLNLDYEAVYNKAAVADFWINVGFTKTLAELKAMDSKNTFFKAWRTGQVYNNNRRNTPSGGFDFWESGIVNPDLILSDLITIFHLGMISGHDLHYYQQLK